ncbi:MAG TPA: zinc-dependent metalloprotease [Jiangellaceae bacterium]|nr:zinc-dependent metalloprotease [Jiangellaceae bacterium]
MSDVPFGFRSDDDDDEGLPEQRGSGGGGDVSGGPDQPDDPFSQLFAALGAGGAGGAPGMPDLGQMLQQLGRMLSWSGGPVNWDLANQSARQVVAAAGDRSVSSSERRDVEQAFDLADTWLNDATVFPATGSSPRTWSRAEWVEGTQAAWQALVDPVAARVSDAMSRALPAEMAQAAGPLVGMMQQIGVSMWGAQVGQSIGKLAGEVFGSTDVGLPLAGGHPVLLPANVRSFGEGLGVDDRDIYLYLALRELAHLRLYAHAPWLRAHLESLVEAYARHVNVDTERIESTLRDIDPQRPEAVQEALEGGLFDLATTPEQQSSLERLELALALIEGWVHDVVTQVAGERLPSAAALAETVRRRRATGGPAEQTFATLVGLELRPRKLREAATFWAAVREARGTDGRDAVWAHPDLLPGADDLAEPDTFLSRDELDPSAFEDDDRPD